MKRACVSLTAIFAITMLSHAAAAPDAEEVFRRSAMVEKVAGWSANSILEIRAGERVRMRAGEAYNRLLPGGMNSHRLFRFHIPADIAGTAFLVHENDPDDDDLWMYLPSMAKTRRILASNKRDSFMGSDFSYADLMTIQPGAFTHRMLATEACGDARCLVVESVPKTEKTRDALGYGKLISHIREDNFLTYRIRYFDPQQAELKVQQVFDYQLIDREHNHWIAARREMTSLRTKRKSILRFEKLSANGGIDAGLFNQNRLGR
jgi:hypothetical protein